jgi:hypothetical protein
MKENRAVAFESVMVVQGSSWTDHLNGNLGNGVTVWKRNRRVYKSKPLMISKDGERSALSPKSGTYPFCR